MRISWLASLVFTVCLGLSGTVGNTTLTVSQSPLHDHWVPGNTSPFSFTTSYGGMTGDSRSTHNKASSPVGGSGSHTHVLSGVSENASSLPPYYALAYIMRCA